MRNAAWYLAVGRLRIGREDGERVGVCRGNVQRSRSNDAADDGNKVDPPGDGVEREHCEEAAEHDKCGVACEKGERVWVEEDGREQVQG